MRIVFFFILSIMIQQATAQFKFDLSKYTPYNGSDLGVTYTPTKTIFKVWCPTMAGMRLQLYTSGDRGLPYKTIMFVRKKDNLFVAEVAGNLINKFYTYQGWQMNGTAKNYFDEVPDIYAKAVGVNGKRGMVVDLKKTNPEGWGKDKSPFKGGLNDAIIYELHVRDATVFTNANNKGKFIGLTEKGLVNEKGASVGLDHIKKLGITHVQLLPIYDYFTVDEKIANNPQYNWGYDPLNYNTPEGGYSSNPYDGNVRIKELKTLVKSLHDNGIAVIMDVVYNHTMFGEKSYLNQLVPNYYYRQNDEGGFSNASACGNETASDRPMMRKFILESVLYWVKEYHIDGFRFDLMAIHDIETMNLIADEVRKLKPNAIILGEGWTAGSSPLSDDDKALKKNAFKMHDVAVFSDDVRDGIKGSVFDHKDSGFVTNKFSATESVKFGLIGAISHPQIMYEYVNYSKSFFTKQPYQMISYNECHDNHTLWDRFKNSNPNDSDELLKQRYTLAMSLVLLGQGVPFIHAGQEMCRTKKGEENSYKSTDDINGIDWNRISEFENVHKIVKQLIAIRKLHPAFRLGNADLVRKHVSFKSIGLGVFEMKISGVANDDWKEIAVFINGSQFNTADINYVSEGYTQKFSSNVYGKQGNAVVCEIWVK